MKKLFKKFISILISGLFIISSLHIVNNSEAQTQQRAGPVQQVKFGIFAISSPDGISLRIAGFPLPSSRDPGYAGYNIYKRSAGDKKFKKINIKLIQKVNSINDLVNIIGTLKFESFKNVTNSRTDDELWQKFIQFDPQLLMWGMLDIDFIKSMGTYYLDRNVKIGQEYEYYVVKVSHDNKEGTPSEIYKIKHGDFPVLLDPVNVKARIYGKAIKVTWDKNEKDTFGMFFNVYRAESPAANFTKINSSPLITTIDTLTNKPQPLSFDDTSVVKRHTYYYKIRSADLYGNLSPGKEIISITYFDLIPPLQVQNLKVKDSRDGLILIWQSVYTDDLAGYRIYRSIDKDTGFTLITPQLLAYNETTYVDMNIQPEHRYFYRVVSVGKNGVEGLPSAVVSGAQELMIVPDPPGYIDAKATDKGILITWKQIEDTVGVRGFYVYRSSSPNKPFEQISDLIPINTLQYIDTSKTLDPRGAYYYQVLSVSRQGHLSLPSNIVSAIPLDKIPPDIPEGLRGWADQIGIHLFWNTPSDPTTYGFNIYRKSENDSKFIRITQKPVPAGNIKYIDSKVEYGKTYEYYITSIDEKNNESKPSNKTKISTLTKLPLPPSNLMITNTPQGILIQWDESYEKGVIGYYVFRKVQGEDWIQINKQLIPQNKPSMIDNQVQNGITYFYRVACVNSSGQPGNESDMIYITCKK